MILIEGGSPTGPGWNRNILRESEGFELRYGRDRTVDHHWKFAEMFMLQRTEEGLKGPEAFAGA
jgi:hypothetical protein